MTVLLVAWLYLCAAALAMVLVKLWCRWRDIPCTLVVAWYDCWLGTYWDRDQGRLFVLFVPMLGLCVSLPSRSKHTLTYRHDGFTTIYYLDGRPLNHHIEHMEGTWPEATKQLLRDVCGASRNEAQWLWDHRKAA